MPADKLRKPAISDGSYYPPVITTVQHRFEEQQLGRFCAKCGGGKLHAVHQTIGESDDAGE